MGGRKVVVRQAEFLPGAPMERRRGVRDWKCVYPETGVDTRTLIMGIVEVPQGEHTPLHRHNCEEVYYVLGGRGEVESAGERFPFEAGDAIFNKENTAHRVFNTHPTDTLRLLVVAGIMLVGLLPRWPTENPYEILET
ncbi:MAG: cupin domain-containing protein [candidate division NC10 bacterium]|nr:cupin domain-containing protein [candidate division NC10 bacterium]